MKKLCFTAIAVLSFLIFSAFTEKTEKTEKTILGTWVNPGTYERSGKMLGFKFIKNGKCQAVGIESLDLEKWSIEGNNLILEGTELNEDGTKSNYHSVKPIVKLTKDTLQVLDRVKGSVRFTYIHTKHLEQLVQSGKIMKGEK